MSELYNRMKDAGLLNDREQRQKSAKEALQLLHEAASLFEKFEQIDGTDIWAEADNADAHCQGSVPYLTCLMGALGLAYFHFTEESDNYELYSQQLVDWQDWYERLTAWEQKHGLLSPSAG